jgi:hypothetical protein
MIRTEMGMHNTSDNGHSSWDALNNTTPLQEPVGCLVKDSQENAILLPRTCRH